MTQNIKTAIKSYLQSIGLKIFDDYSTVNTLEFKDEPLIFMNINNIEVSQWATSIDGSTYGAEVTGHICLRVMDISHNQSNGESLNNYVDKIISKLCYVPDILITSIKREDIFYNKVLGRREARIFVDFKNFITDSITSEEEQTWTVYL